MGYRRRDLLLDGRFVAAVAVLAVNDWVLKAWLGSGPARPITGKLSDLAAMVVGPVLVVVLGPAALRRRPALALVPPGLLLAATNLSTSAAAAYEWTLEAVTPLDHHVVLDATDLLGLAGLIIGWRVLRQPRPLPVERRRVMALAMGVAAIGVATASSGPQSAHRDRVVVEGGRVVAVSEYANDNRVSDDDGVTWTSTGYGAIVDGPVERPEEATTSLCLRADADICVRLADSETIEESRDGGRTWDVVWQTGGDADRWLENGTHGYDGSWESIGLTDLAETDRGSVVVAATVMDPIRRGPDGQWAPSVADLRHFQGWIFAPLALAVVFMMVGLAAVGADRSFPLGSPPLVAGALMLGLPVLWYAAARAEVFFPTPLVLVGLVAGVAIVLISGGGRGLVGGFGMLLATGGVLLALIYFPLLDVIGFVFVGLIPPVLLALVMVVVLLARGAARLLVRNLAAAAVIVVAAALPLLAWSSGRGRWDTMHQTAALVAVTLSGLVGVILVPADRRRASGGTEIAGS